MKTLNNKKEIKLFEVSKSTVTDVCAKYCIDERNEIYFMAYITNPEHPISVLWSDMKFLRRNFGVDILNGKFNVDSKITEYSLNKNRLANIEKMLLAIKLNVHERDLEYWNGGNFGSVDNHYYLKHNPNLEFDGLDTRKTVPREPTKLTKSHKEYLQQEIDKGLFVICKYV